MSDVGMPVLAMAMLLIAGDPWLRKNYALRRIVELDAQTAKLVDDAKIDGLLQVEQGIEIGLLHEIRELEVQGGIAQGFQVTALKTNVRVFANDALEQRRDSLELVEGRFVGHANRRQRALFLGTAEIAHAAFQKIGVRENDLFAGVAAQSR